MENKLNYVLNIYSMLCWTIKQQLWLKAKDQFQSNKMLNVDFFNNILLRMTNKKNFGRRQNQCCFVER